MSPEKAKVFIAEDDEDYQKYARKILEGAGHTVVATATTLPEALKIVAKLEELGINVAAIDGNLRPNSVGGYDGQTILKAIKEQAPNVKTVGISSLKIPGADANAGKLHMDKLGEIVRNL